jgi:hypothetical protein
MTAMKAQPMSTRVPESTAPPRGADQGEGITVVHISTLKEPAASRGNGAEQAPDAGVKRDFAGDRRRAHVDSNLAAFVAAT